MSGGNVANCSTGIRNSLPARAIAAFMSLTPSKPMIGRSL